MQQLLATSLEKMQQVDVDLRKKIDTSNQQLFLSGSSEVPTQFRQSVEDYWRALAASKKAPTTSPAKNNSGKGGGQ
jgi:hypothetical protein